MVFPIDLYTAFFEASIWNTVVSVVFP